ncbi:MAG: hypothetical protein WCC98_16740 [Candidatus Acidiferrales bacterium]
MALELDDDTRAQLGFGQKTVTLNERFDILHPVAAPSKNRRFVPAFAANTAQLQAVLLHAAVKYVYRAKPIPPGFVPDIDEIIRLAKERHAENRAWVESHPKLLQQRIYEHIICVEQAGSYVAMISAVAYRMWLLEWTAPTIAKDLGCKKELVWQITEMLAFYANELGFPTYERHSSKDTVKVNEQVILSLWQQGFSIREIVRHTRHCRYRIGRVLKSHDLHQHKRMNQAKVNAIVRMWRGGSAVNEIRRKLHCSYQIVVKILTVQNLYVARSKAFGSKKWAASRKLPVTSCQVL